MENQFKITSIVVKMEDRKLPEWMVPGYPPLKCDDSVGQASVNGQLVYYPKVVRQRGDKPIRSQQLGLLSFMLFQEPKKFQTGQPVYGFVKLRGNYASKSEAENRGGKIIREMDSRFPVRVAPVGQWVPITEEMGFCKDILDIKMSEQEHSLQDKAIKEKQKIERRRMKEIQRAERELKEAGDIYDDPSSLDFYTMKRVTELRLKEQIEFRKRGIDSMEEKRKLTQKILKRLELENPEYTDQWIDNYNEQRKKGGIADYIPPEKQIETYKEELSAIVLEGTLMKMNLEEMVEKISSEDSSKPELF